MNESQIASIRRMVETLYSNQSGKNEIKFHGLPHINFVCAKAIHFAKMNGANLNLVNVSALLHDLNYVEARDSKVEIGRRVRSDILTTVGVEDAEISKIEDIICSADITSQIAAESLEAQALSDADTLFKILPITPVLFSHHYLNENSVSIGELARKIIKFQVKKFENGSLFYNKSAYEKYRKWADANYKLWTQILECEEDNDIAKLISSAC